MAAIDLNHLFDDYVKNHQKVWKHDRSQSVGASESFGCIRKTFFGKMGYAKDFDHKESWGALQRGDLIENYFVEPAVSWFMANRMGDARLIWGGKHQKTLVDGRLSATPDGLVINAPDDALALYGVPSLGGTGCFNLEIKSIDPRVNLKEEKAIHKGQVQVQMGLTRKLTIHKPNYALIIYVDASFFDDIEPFVIPYDENAFKVAQQRADKVFHTKQPIELMPEGKIDGSCEYCPFKHVCSETNEIHTPQSGELKGNEAPLAIMEEFVELVQEERLASSAKKIAEREHKEAAEKLKHWFRETGVKRATAPDTSVKATISFIKGRKTYDYEAMRADGIDIDKYLKQGDGYDKLTISEKGGLKADEE